MQKSFSQCINNGTARSSLGIASQWKFLQKRTERNFLWGYLVPIQNIHLQKCSTGLYCTCGCQDAIKFKSTFFRLEIYICIYISILIDLFWLNSFSFSVKRICHMLFIQFLSIYFIMNA